MSEVRGEHPELDDESSVVGFRSGRYADFWVHNLVALGNASGFVEPLEASALHVLVEQIRLTCRVLSDGGGRIVPSLRDAGNRRYRMLWDEVRDFLAIHYKFNGRRDTPFWRHCRAETDLAGATELVQLYREAGPSSLCSTVLPSGHIFGYDGFMTLLVGQRVPTAYRGHLNDEDRNIWNNHRDKIRQDISRASPMEQGLRMIYGS